MDNIKISVALTRECLTSLATEHRGNLGIYSFQKGPSYFVFLPFNKCYSCFEKRAEAYTLLKI